MRGLLGPLRARRDAEGNLFGYYIAPSQRVAVLGGWRPFVRAANDDEFPA